MFKNFKFYLKCKFFMPFFQWLIFQSLLIDSFQYEICENCLDTKKIPQIPNNSTRKIIIISNGLNFNFSSNSNCSITVKTITCYGGFDTNTNVQNLLIDEIILNGWQSTTFDPVTVLKYFPNIRKLRIENSKNFTHIFNDFPFMNNLESINISWTNFAYTRPTLFKRLHNLKFLDLRWNQLDHMEGPLILSKTFQELYLTGNPWNCTTNLKWLLNIEKSKNVIDREQLICNDTKYFGRNLLTVMNYKSILKEECQNHDELRNCSCSMHYIRRSDDGKSLIPIYAINCSYLNLYNLPSYLPKNTTVFYVTNNKISDVNALRNNAVYSSVIDIYLDYNQIQSIDILEAGNWLRNFRVFSLKGNKLTKLPVYALDNALENNQQAACLYLSLNPWQCDCKFTMKLRELLMKYHTIIKDSTDVLCKYQNNDIDNYKKIQQVLLIERNDLCKLPEETNIQPIEIINFVLGSLICFILIKLAYDYYNYRQYGRLPWIITKIP